jgi:glycosyltransferase involved in cell wall biosynthesis
MSICILLPTYNEAGSIKEMIERVRKVGPSFRIYVVDSGSNDGTVQIAEKAGAKLIILEKRGKGIAIKEAFEKIGEDVAVLLDSDASYLPEEMPLLLEALKSCDIVVGSRFIGKIEPGSMKPLNKLGNRMLTALADVLYGKNNSDICSGFWAFSKKAYKSLVIDAPHFELEANFFTEAAKKKLRLCEVPITYTVRQGETKLSAMHGFHIAWYLLARRVF